jgi:glutaminyl-peptide cyclotransferase
VRKGRRGMPGVLVILLILAGCGSGSSEDGGQDAARFDAGYAWRLVKRQVEVGQRPAGSPALRKLAAGLRPFLPRGRFEGIPGEPRLRNVVGVLPGVKPAIVVAAHYDTLAKPRGFVGANNGAAGTAVVLATARALSATEEAGAREVRFVLFDGEEPAAELPEESGNFYREGLRGSRAYVAAHRDDTAAMILLDYVGNRGLSLPREATSDESLWSRLLIAAETVGAARSFSARTGVPITDDHTPFLRAGIPAVDLIDWRYPGHSLTDGLDKLSKQSLAAVGETVVRLVGELRRE